MVNEKNRQTTRRTNFKGTISAEIIGEDLLNSLKTNIDFLKNLLNRTYELDDEVKLLEIRNELSNAITSADSLLNLVVEIEKELEAEIEDDLNSDPDGDVIKTKDELDKNTNPFEKNITEEIENSKLDWAKSHSMQSKYRNRRKQVDMSEQKQSLDKTETNIEIIRNE